MLERVQNFGLAETPSIVHARDELAARAGVVDVQIRLLAQEKTSTEPRNILRRVDARLGRGILHRSRHGRGPDHWRGRGRGLRRRNGRGRGLRCGATRAVHDARGPTHALASRPRGHGRLRDEIFRHPLEPALAMLVQVVLSVAAAVLGGAVHPAVASVVVRALGAARLGGVDEEFRAVSDGIALVIRGVFNLAHRARLADFRRRLHGVRHERLHVFVRQRTRRVRHILAPRARRGTVDEKRRVLVLEAALTVAVRVRVTAASIFLVGAVGPDVTSRVLLARQAARSLRGGEKRAAQQNLTLEFGVFLRVTRRDRSRGSSDGHLGTRAAVRHRRGRDWKRARVFARNRAPAGDDVIGTADEEASGAERQGSFGETDAKSILRHDNVDVIAREFRRRFVGHPRASERLRGKRDSKALASNLEPVGIDGGGVGDRHGDAVHVHAGAASMSDDPRRGGDADVVGVNLGDDAVEDHVEERRACGELEVLVRIPPEHERGREQRELSRVFRRRLRVAVRREERNHVLHRRGVHLLEAEQEVAVTADEEFPGLQPDVPERHSRANRVDVEGDFRARHRAVAAVGSVRRRGHQLRAPAHEHETIGVRNLRRTGHLVDDDRARKLKRDGDASKADGRVPRVGDDDGDVHLAGGGGPAGRGRVDSAHANEIFGWKGGPRRDGELERAGGEVGAVARGRRVGGRLEKASREVVRRACGGGGGGGDGGSRSRSRGGRWDVAGI